jgi:hypothetical protein
VNGRTALLALLPAIIGVADAAAPGAAAQAEISHLLSYLGTSGCEFQRNGSWHDARAARAHPEKKYRYLANRSLIGSAEDFIDRAATSSSVTGETYYVRCPPNQAVASADWLRAELERLRASAQVP